MIATLGEYVWWAMGRTQAAGEECGLIESPGDQRERFCRRVTLIASEAAKAARARLTDVDWTDAFAATDAMAVGHAGALERYWDAFAATAAEERDGR